MSPRTGGEADKFGARYEILRWVVRRLLAILSGEAETIRLEPGDDIEGSIEFEFVRVAAREVHQVKRQHGLNSNWTLKSLEREGVLASAVSYVSADYDFVFVSTIPAYPLEELVDRARRSDDEAVFSREMLTSTGLRRGFESLAATWGSPEAVWKTLRRMEIRHEAESSLHETNLTLAKYLIDGPPEASAAVLAAIAFDTIGRTLDAETIWNELEKRDLHPAADQRRASASKTITSLTDAWMDWRRKELLEPEIDREESTSVMERIHSGTTPLLLAGHAGSGKSVVMLQAAASIREQDWPVLAFRLDRVPPVASAERLGQELGLEASPVVTLATLAQDRPSVLLIDQLDAVSLISGRLPELFEVVTEILRQAKDFPSMRVVMSCRRFDLDHDHRLATLVDKERSNVVEVGALSQGQVEDSVAAMGLDPTTLSGQQVDVLSSPIHLVLLRSVADRSDALTFTSSRGLFDLYWTQKRRLCSRRTPKPRFEATVRVLVDDLTAHRRLSAPIEAFDADDLIGDAEVLISEHVLVQEGREIAFFHESFFDYAFARLWRSTPRSLLEFLETNDQELFRRAQVRQVLLHLRDDEPDRFISEVRDLLLASSVRFHIKQAVLALVHGLADPTADECLLMNALLEEPDLKDRVRLTLRTVPWFDAVLRGGLVDHWLEASDDRLNELAVELLGVAAGERANEVAGLLGKQTENPRYGDWLRWVVRFGSMEKGRKLFDLVLDGVRSGVWNQHQHLLWISAHELGEQNPSWGIELLTAWFLERPDALRLDSQGRIESLKSSDYGLIELLKRTSRELPANFAEAFVPILEQVLMLTSSDGRHRHFSYRMWNSDDHDVEDVLLSSLTSSVRAMADTDLGRLRGLLESLVGKQDEVLRYLLYEGLRTAAPEFADWAGEVLQEGGDRLQVGYADSPYWSTRQVLEANAPHMSDDIFEKVERTLLDHRPASEQRAEARRWRGRAQFTLLSALPRERLSHEARRLLDEFRRKFDQDEPEPPVGMIFGVVRSPIETESARKMTDEQWLKAIAKYADDTDTWRADLRGGAHELGQVLETVTKEEPDRFARLGLRMDVGAHPSYLSAILRGLGSTEEQVDNASIFDLVRRAAALGVADIDRWLGWALRRILDQDVPADVIEALISRSMATPDPEDELWEQEASSGDAYYGGDPHSFGMNTARGSLAESLGDLVIVDSGGTRAGLVLPHVGRLASDRSLGVRTCVAHLLHALLRFDRERVLGAFEVLIEVDDRLLAVRNVENLIAAISVKSPNYVHPIITRMLESSIEEVRETGGRLGMFVSMVDDPEPFQEKCVTSDDVAIRRGTAEVLAARLKWAKDRKSATDSLDVLLHDPDATVRDAAAGFVIALRDEDLNLWEEPIRRLLASPSFDKASAQLLITLERSTDCPEELILATARRFLEEYGQAVGDISTGAAGDAREVGQLVLRAYARSGSSDVREEALDLIDGLLSLDAFGFADAVQREER